MPAMKITVGVISDTHLHRVTKELERIYETYLSDKDLILHAGDIVSTEVLDFLSRHPFHAVYGNMDPLEVKGRLPGKKVIQVGPYRLGLIHGSGSSEGLEDRVRPAFDDVDVIVYGHSHKTANNLKGGVLLFNPGTVTGFTSTGTHTLGILNMDDTIRGEIVTL